MNVSHERANASVNGSWRITMHEWLIAKLIRDRGKVLDAELHLVIKAVAAHAVAIHIAGNLLANLSGDDGAD